MHLEALARAEMSLFYSCFWKLASECRVELLILSLCCDLLQFMPSKVSLLLMIWPRGETKLLLKEVALVYCIIFEGKFIMLSFESECGNHETVWDSHTHSPFLFTIIPCAVIFPGGSGYGWGAGGIPSHKRLHWMANQRIAAVRLDTGRARTKSSGHIYPWRDRLLHTRVSWGNYIQNMGVSSWMQLRVSRESSLPRRVFPVTHLTLRSQLSANGKVPR